MSTNGWGKGSVNNTNGWGAGAINNDNGWGDSHLKSWSGDTDIDGGTGIPVNNVAPVISGATTLGSLLTTTNGTWTAKPAATFTYQWKRNGLDIEGATNSTYTLVNEDGATNIFCKVTATNDFGSASANSNTLAITAFTDADAQAFITAASITDPTQQSAINTLVTDLKGYGVWSKMKAIYPFVGGTASSHKFNLKDPRDLDAAFRLVFNGGWTHSSTGAKPNGTNGYADTKLSPSPTLTNNNTHLSYYCRDNISGAYIDFGTQYLGDLSIYNYGGIVYSDHYNRTTARATGTSADTRGLIIGSRTTSSVHKIYKNGVQLGTTNTGVASTLSPLVDSLFFGAARTGISTALYFSPRQYAFASIGDGLTDTEAANFYTAVNNFQVALSRNV